MTIEHNNVIYDSESQLFLEVPTKLVGKYLKGVYRTYEQFKLNILDNFAEHLTMLEDSEGLNELERLEKYYIREKKFTYLELFNLPASSFKSKAFGSINIEEMIMNLGATKHNVDGINLNLRKYKIDGSYEIINYDAVYEIWKVNLEKLDLREFAYVVKCWCTSTDKEHYLWINSEFRDDPLQAIASTCVIYENMLPHIESIKRQGDIFLFEMKEAVSPEGNKISLNKEQYFKLLVAQT